MGTLFDVSSDKAQGLTGFVHYVGDMRVPFKVVADGHPQVFGFVYLLEYLATEFIQLLVWFLGSMDGHGIAFR